MRRLTDEEIGRVSSATKLAAAAIWCASVSSAANLDHAATDVRGYVRNHPFGAPAVEVVALFDSRTVPELVAMLEAEEPYWGTVVAMLVALEDERAVDALITFVETPALNPALSDFYENARRQAIIGLGHLVRRTGSEDALMYLLQSLAPSTWEKRNVRGVAEWTQSFEEYDSLLAEYAVYGLAYSAHPRAGAALRDLQQSPTPAQLRLRKNLGATLHEWLEVYDLVAHRGLDGARASHIAQQRKGFQLQLEETVDTAILRKSTPATTDWRDGDGL